MGVTYGQPLSDPSNAQGGNPYIRGTSAYYHYGAYAPQYTDDTLKILGLHEEQRISGFVHGQKIRSLAEFLSIDLPTSYKDQWHDTNECRELRYRIEEAMKSRQLAHLVKGIKKGKAKGSDTQQGDQKKRDKNAAPIEAPILMINREDRTPKIKSMEESLNGIGEITFPHPSLRSLKVDLKVPLVGFSGEHSWPLREVPLEITIGIRATPSKVKAVTDLEIPKTLKDIQSLNGNLAALSRFLSKGAEKSLPFFKALKSCTDKKTIQWTIDAEKAFQRMKKFMEILPTLIVPIKGEVLVMYLAASTEIISVVLLAERGEEQVPIYFKTPKYFQAHPIRVLTDAPIKQTLANPKKSGRIAKWAIKLENETITTRGTLARKENLKLDDRWKLYTDGASSFDGSGTGLMLIILGGKEYTYALRFEFETTNNEAEYEALLAGL
ncbi:reverse transcriptase domain-containing protein [Tanacetum coccineum]